MLVGIIYQSTIYLVFLFDSILFSLLSGEQLKKSWETENSPMFDKFVALDL